MSTIKEMNELNRKTRRNKAQGGFTLIELMIVVAIIGILAAIAIPRYQDYVARSQVTEAITLVRGYKVSVEEQLFQGQVPADIASLGGRDTGRYVQSVDILNSTLDLSASPASGTFTIFAVMASDAAPAIAGRSLGMQYVGAEDEWLCGGFDGSTPAEVSDTYLPQACQDTLN